MVVLEVATLSGASVVISEEAVEELKGKLRGQLILPGDETYDEARKVWNLMIDRRPALIVRCGGVSDVINAVNFARDNDLLVAVRGGGHSFAGNAVCDGGIVIDLSPMQGIWVDPVKQTARAQPGVRWIDFDIETQAFGLATTGGTNSDTGIAGLTLGGGRLVRGLRGLGDPSVGFGHAFIALDGGQKYDFRFVGASLGQQGVAEP